MTYQQAGLIQSPDYNALAGLSNTASASALAATNIVGSLWGVGWGDRGYGQTSPVLSNVSAANPIGQEWQNMRTALATMVAWQGTDATLEPPASNLAAGHAVVAYSSGRLPYDLVTLIGLVDANRNNHAGATFNTSAAVTSTQSVNWGAAPNGDTITAVFNASFADEDHARYFFNSGCELRLNFSHTNTSTSQNSSWNTAINGLSVALKRNSTVKNSGNTGSGTSIGYYQLTTNWQTIYNGANTGAGLYASCGYTVEAAVVSISGMHGGNGNSINFRVTLNDPTAIYQDVVNAGTSVSLVATLPAAGLSITAPSLSVSSNFAGVNPPSVVSSFNTSVSSGIVPLTVQFYDTTTGSPTTWYWDFGDGNTSTAQNPSHTFNGVAAFTVTLVTTNLVSSSTATRTITVNPQVPVASFYGTPTSGQSPLSVQFYDTSSNSPTSWYWDFGDGNTSSAQNPSHTYSTAQIPGQYFTVIHYAANVSGSNGTSIGNYIYVTAPGYTYSVSMQFTPDFQAQGSGSDRAAYYFYYNGNIFGDGTAGGISPSPAYASGTSIFQVLLQSNAIASAPSDPAALKITLCDNFGYLPQNFFTAIGTNSIGTLYTSSASLSYAFSSGVYETTWTWTTSFTPFTQFTLY